MSQMKLAIALIAEHGEATVDDILPECEGLTRAQVMKALDNAVNRGLLKPMGLSDKERGPHGKRMMVYSPTGESVAVVPSRPLPPRGKYGHIGKVSSVFALGQQ